MMTVLLWLLLHFMRGGDRMAIVVVYATLIIAGRREFSQVPASLQPAVESELAALGLGTDGQLLQAS